MRDPQALHVGSQVITPNGLATIRARRCAGGIWQWLALDYWWRESQLIIPEPPPRLPAGPAWVAMSSRCEQGAHDLCSTRCKDEGETVPCGCSCHIGAAA